MPRGRYRYMMDRASRRNRRGDYRRERMMYEPYGMAYRNDMSEYSNRRNTGMGEDRRYYQEPYMDYKRPGESYRVYDYEMRNDYARGRNRGPEYNKDDDYRYERRRDYRGDYRSDYSDEDYDEEYYEDLEKWIKKLKKDDRFGLNKEQVIQKAQEMGVSFKDYDEEEFYAIYLMHMSDYPQVANEPHTYLAMAKAWLEDKDLHIEPSEKVCKYLYEIVMAEED